MFKINVKTNQLEGINQAREIQSENFSEAIQIYMDAVTYYRQGVLFDSDLIGAIIEFRSYGRLTEATRIGFHSGGGLKISTKQY